MLAQADNRHKVSNHISVKSAPEWPKAQFIADLMNHLTPCFN